MVNFAFAARIALDDTIHALFGSGPYLFLVGQFIWHFPYLLLGIAVGNEAMEAGRVHP